MLIDIANEQVKAEDVTVIIVNDSYQQFLLDLFDKRVKILLMKRKPGSRSIVPLLRLNYMLWSMRPDVVHIHSSSLLSVILPSAGRGLFYTVHDLNIPLKYSRHVTCMFAISDAVKEDMDSRCPIVTIPNGIASEKIDKRAHKPFGGCMKIVEVARLVADKKGQDVLIRAIALLRKRGLTNITVDFIGEGPSYEYLQCLAQKLGVAEQIHFLGLRNRTYIYSHLCDYDLMCNPSRYEGFGLAVAEGMAARLPVLVSDDGGPYEIIERGKYGYSFRNEDVEDCALRIKHIYRNYSQVLELVDMARKHVEVNYSIEKMVKSYIEEYKKRIKSR